VLIDALAEQLPTVSVRGAAAGLHLIAWLPDGADEDAIADAAAFLVSTQARWITGQHMPARESRARGPGDPQVA